jgi:rSAM/selenodomain-associated transferase 2
MRALAGLGLILCDKGAWFQAGRADAGLAAVSISVIIPTLNEASCLGQTLQQLRLHKPEEIIVVDGGSMDGTCRLAVTADRLLDAPRGRASQMNRGAAQARGDVLLFLHADCTLEEGALACAEENLGRRGVAAGCFRMCVRAPGPAYRLIDRCATARVRLTGLIYGDQGLFVSRDLFRRVGGFPPLRLMEDVFLSKTLRRQGRLTVAPRRIFVSPRRWRRQGLVRQTLRNWTLTVLAAGGMHPDRLAAFYPVVR